MACPWCTMPNGKHDDQCPYDDAPRSPELSIGRVTIFDTPIITNDRRPSDGKYGRKWGNK